MNTAAWGAEEQRLLEQALKTYPVSTPDRWDRIAQCVPNRTKKDCMRRYKVCVYGGEFLLFPPVCLLNETI